MEQRAHIRHAVDMAGNLSTAEHRDHPCRITDFCLGGVFIQLSGSPEHLLQNLARGDELSLRLQVNGSRGPRDVVLPARVARVAERGLGVAFEKPDPMNLLALQNHVRSLREGGTTPGKPVFEPERIQAILNLAVETVRGFLAERLAAFFDQAATDLQAGAAKAASNTLQEPWYEALDSLRKQGEALSRSFLQKAINPLETVIQGLPGGLHGESAGVAEGSSRLSLVDKDLFEDWLTLKVMASRAESDVQDDLLPLQLRFDELLGLSVRSRRNPLHPSIICSAFGEALRLVPMKSRIDRVVLEAFEKTVVSDLSALYGELNQVLADEDVLPDLDVGRYLAEHYQPRAEQQPDKPKPAATGENGADDDRSGPGNSPAPGPSSGQTARGTATEAGVAVAERPDVAAAGSAGAFARQQRIANQAYDTVKRILEARRQSAESRPDSSQMVAPPAPPAVVTEALEKLQNRVASVPPDAEAAPLPERVQQAVEDQGGEDLGLDQELHTAAEVIHHLFDGIISNPALSDRVRRAIKRLEVPFLRLLLDDEAFLHEEEHPARRMLNRIADLGVRGSPNLDRHEQAIDQQVEDVLANFSNDISIFNKTLENLDQLSQKQSRLYERNVSRITEAYEGRQKVVLARREVNQALERRIGGREVPRALLALVDAGWRQLLVHTLLREGRDSRAWHQYLGVVDKMLEAARELPPQESLSALLAAIKEGLARVDETQVRNPGLVAELRGLLSVRARNEAGFVPVVKVPAGMVDASDPADFEDLGEEEKRRRRKASRYEPGDWFELREEEGAAPQYIRLAWVSADRDLFVFVNHQGLKIQEFELADFSERLARGLLQPVDALDAPAVDRGLEVMVQKVYDQMADRARHDELTGLLSRREFERRVRQSLQDNEQGRASLVHLDVDQFKVVNNTGGPEAGDAVLRQLGELMREVLPGSSVARLSGDEFAIWLDDISEEAAVRAVRSLRERIEKHRVEHGGHSHAVTVSCGLVHRQGAADTASTLMHAAESACQAAKEDGRNRLQQYFSDDENMARRDDVMVWVTRLNEALDNDQLELRCQRIEPANDEESAAYEVLIAIRSEDGTLVPPADFVQAAERFNRMHAVDRWVIENVLRWMHANPEVVKQLDHLSINLSGHSLNDATLPEFLFEHFHRYPVPRDSLCFEVTETTAIANLDDAADFIRTLQQLGCRFSLDDFGSGLASYGYLKHLPVDYIKIDGTFIRDIGNDPADLALVRSINEMGHLMGKRTIAEFVETDAIRQALTEIGVDFFQGFGIEKPRPLESLRELAG